MKILFINRAKTDYVQELLYTGLSKIIGAQNIIETPWNPRLHINFRPYPKKMNRFNISELAQSLRAQCTKNYDVVIVASCHPHTMQTYYKMMDQIPDGIHRVFIDGGDFPEIAGDLNRLGGMDLYEKIIQKRAFDLIFKREYLLTATYPSNVYALPMSFNYDFLPPLDHKYRYDVAFWAVESDPIRTKVLTLIEDKFDCKENGTIRNQIMKKYKRKGTFYLQELARSKIGLNFRGVGWDTLRIWELAAMGCFVISQKLDIKIDPPFVDGEDIVYCKDDLSDLIELCEYYLKHDEQREAIARSARKKVAQYHTDVARARFVMDKIENFTR